VAWSGSAVIEPGRLLFAGTIGDTEAHAHAAAQIVVITTGSVRLTDAAGTSATATSAVIPTGARHAMDTDSAHGLLIYIEPSSRAGRALASLFHGRDRDRVELWTGTASRLGGVPDQVTAEDPRGAADAVLDALISQPAGPRPVRESHPSVRRAVELLPELMGQPVRLHEVAQRVALSPDRLGRLFARDLGLSFPAYVRWTRLMRAIDEVRHGATFTDAAHAAGFTDSSHANRVCHEMFGLAPLAAARHLRWR
jgi:AraC-like DNA-binding protein